MKKIKTNRKANNRTENLDILKSSWRIGEALKAAVERITFYPYLRLCERSKILITIGILILKSVIK